jgi:hypothetical protein
LSEGFISSETLQDSWFWIRAKSFIAAITKNLSCVIQCGWDDEIDVCRFSGQGQLKWHGIIFSDR